MILCVCLFVLFCSFCFCSYSEKNWELLTKNRRTSALTGQDSLPLDSERS